MIFARFCSVVGLVALGGLLFSSGCALGPSLPGRSSRDLPNGLSSEEKSLAHQFEENSLGGLAIAGKATTASAALAEAIAVQREGNAKSAIKYFRRVAVKWPEAPEAALALRSIADIQLEKSPEKAFVTYQILIDRHAGKFDFEEILDQQMEIASAIQGEKSIGARYIPGLHNEAKAIPYYEQIIRNAPAWDRSSEAQYIIGVIFQSDKEYFDATQAYRRFLEEYPGSELVERASFHMAECYYEIAKGRSTERQIENAYVHLNRFLEKFDGSEFTPKAFEYKQEVYEMLAENAFEVGQYYDKKKRYESAVVSYREFVNRYPAAKQVPAAMKRIRELDPDAELPSLPELRSRTEESFRTGGPSAMDSLPSPNMSPMPPVGTETLPVRAPAPVINQTDEGIEPVSAPDSGATSMTIRVP